MRDNSSHIVIIFLLTIITVNLFLLDLKVFAPENNIKISDITAIATPVPSPITNYQLPIANSSCPNSCLAIINQASEASRLGASNLTNLSNPSSTSIQREFYIPLGTGSTTKSDWDDLTATETVIDPANYGNIKEAFFIASLKNPTQNGQVEAQLYNVTDKHLVWDSHTKMSGPVSQTITSNKITLDKGTKLYRVQLKSTMGFSASLENAKIRIITQ